MPPSDEDCDDAGSDGSDGNGKEVTQGFAPCGEEATGGHGDGADDEGPGGDLEICAGKDQLRGSGGEDEVKKAESEKRNVAEAREASAPGVVAAHPVVAVEEEADEGAGEDSGKHAEPATEQIDLCHLPAPFVRPMVLARLGRTLFI